MTPERLVDCLATIRWTPFVFAEAMDVPIAQVESWLDGSAAIPKTAAAWLEALSFVHEAAAETIPLTSGAGFAPDPAPRLEHIPVYAYHLLRRLAKDPIPLRSLFGSEDEGAVFFLTSRGLAERRGTDLVSLSAGHAIGEIE